MKFKICLLLGILYSINTCAYADYVGPKRFPKRTTAIQSTTVKFAETNTKYNYNAYQTAIEEVKQQLSIEQNNYLLNINLANLYLKSGEYKKSFEELTYIKKLNEQNKLNATEIEALKSLYFEQRSNIRTVNQRGNLYANLSLLAQLNNDKVSEENYINQALNTGSTSDIIAKAINTIYSTNGNIQKGIEACDKILYKKPNSIAARETKANLLLEKNNINEAIKEYTQLVALTPNNKENKYKLYKLLENKDLSKEAIVSKLYAATSMKNEDAYYDLATILLENNEIDATKYYANLLTKKPETAVQGNMILSEIFRKQGNLEDSYKALNEVKNNVNNKQEIEDYNVQLAKLSSNPIEEAKKLNQQGLYDQALKLLSEQDQNNLQVILETASAHFNKGDKKSSLEELNRALTLYPEQVEIYCYFASFYMLEKDFETSKKYLAEANKLDPNNKVLINSYKTLGMVEANEYIPHIEKAIDEENYQEAERLVLQALKLSEHLASIHFYRGYLQVAQNNYAGATAYLYKALELDPNYYLAHFYLAISFEALEEYQNALSNYEMFIQKTPADAFEHQNRVIHSKEKLVELQSK